MLMRSVSLNTPGQQVQIQCDGNHAADRDDLLVGLSWDFYPGTTPVDLDASAVCFDNLGVVQDAAYFNKLSIFDGALTHSGDSLDGAGSGFDETIAFDVDKLPLNVHMVAIVVNAHDEGSNFTHVESANCAEPAIVIITMADGDVRAGDWFAGPAPRQHKRAPRATGAPRAPHSAAMENGTPLSLANFHGWPTCTRDLDIRPGYMGPVRSS